MKPSHFIHNLLYYSEFMEIDPHTIQHLLEKVRAQLRCPQCTKRVDVRFDSLKVMGDSFAVFQMQCRTCGAYILLHATLTGMKPAPLGSVERVSRSLPNVLALSPSPHQHNFSTVLEIDEKEIMALRNALKSASGRFSDLFEEK